MRIFVQMQVFYLVGLLSVKFFIELAISKRYQNGIETLLGEKKTSSTKSVELLPVSSLYFSSCLLLIYSRLLSLSLEVKQLTLYPEVWGLSRGQILFFQYREKKSEKNELLVFRLFAQVSSAILPQRIYGCADETILR